MEFLDHLSTLGARFLGLDKTAPGLGEVLLALALSFALQCFVALVYKRTFRGSKYSQDYVHMLLIMGTVVTVVIQAVRGDKATAFGMFAIFSIIRFGHSLQQSRDLGFIFLAMAGGLGIGAREYAMTTVIILALGGVIYFFSKAGIFPAQRHTHYLRIRVTNELNYDTAFQQCFDDLLARWEVVSVQPVVAGMMTELRLNVMLKDTTKPGALVPRIQQLNGNNRVLLTSAAPQEAMSD